MAPLLPTSPAASETLRSPPGRLLGGLASVGPVITIILLLLLCFPFKRRKRQLSTRDPTRDSNTSELLSMIKLDDGSRPEEKSLENGNLSKGTCLPDGQPERPTNGMAAAEFREEHANPPTVTQTMSRTPQRFGQRRKVEVDRLRGTAPQGLSPGTASPNALQGRKLPRTPKEAHLSRTEPLIQDMDNGVYESICHEESDPGARFCTEGRKGADPSTNGRPNSSGGLAPSLESLEPAGKGAKILAGDGSPGQPAAGRPDLELPGDLAGMAYEREASRPGALDEEKRLSAMYARVLKRPKAAGQQAPAKDGKASQREDDDEPPPIPEKHFEDLYESLSIDTEVQGGVMAGMPVSSKA